MKHIKLIIASVVFAWAGSALAQHTKHQHDVTAAPAVIEVKASLHVLELAAPLKLTNDQRSATEKLMADHKAMARDLGVQVIASERALDSAFALKQVDTQRIIELTQRIGALQANLRAEHLQTHLRQTALLSAQQVASYQTLRGYDGSGVGKSHQHAH